MKCPLGCNCSTCITSRLKDYNKVLEKQIYELNKRLESEKQNVLYYSSLYKLAKEQVVWLSTLVDQRDETIKYLERKF